MPVKQLLESAKEEGSYAITASFTDEDGAVLDIETAKWTLKKPDGTVVNGRVDVVLSSPGTKITVILQGADLAILDSKEREKRRFIFKGTYNSGIPLNEEAEFYVEAIEGND